MTIRFDDLPDDVRRRASPIKLDPELAAWDRRALRSVLPPRKHELAIFTPPALAALTPRSAVIEAMRAELNRWVIEAELRRGPDDAQRQRLEYALRMELRVQDYIAQQEARWEASRLS